MPAPERIRTERLLLRRPTSQDAEAIFERYASDAEVTHYMAWPTHVSIEQTRAFLNFSESLWQRWSVGPYIIESPESGTLLGSTGIEMQSVGHAETGYVLARDAWQKGYATESLKAVLAITRTLSVRRVTAWCHYQHTASQRVLEKCGFKQLQLEQRFIFPNLDAHPYPTTGYEKLLRAN